MPTLVVETGSGVAGANSYISSADADVYFDERLYSALWTAADADDKLRALIMAATMLDSVYQWNGVKVFDANPMQWPRIDVLNPDSGDRVFAFNYRTSNYLDHTVIHQWLKDAQCELALSLLTSNRTSDPDGEGIASFELTGVLKVDFDQATKQRPLPDHVKAWVSKFGSPLYGSGSVKLTRA